MMVTTRNIFNEQGCLSQIAIEEYIRGSISQSENILIQDHIKSCTLCNNALKGAGHINNDKEYSDAIHDLRNKWSERRAESSKFDQVKLTFILSVAATILLIFTIVILARHQKQVRYEILSQLTEQGVDIDNAISDLQIRELDNSSSVFKYITGEDSARKEFFKSGQSEESTLPVAQIEETIIYPETFKYDYHDVITTNKERRQPDTRQLRSPFSVMSHAPANKHYRIPDEIADKDDIFVIVEDMPRFQGGDFLNFRKYVLTNIRYPKDALEENVSGRVFIQFVINREGELVDAKIIKSDHALLDKEVLRVISQSPRWSPGKQRGKAVDVSLIMPVDFVLKR